MDKDFLGLISEVLLPERLGEALQKDGQHKAAVTEEKRLFELLESSLNEEQKETLMDYFNAANDTAARRDILAYRQGMKDLLSLFSSLSLDSGSELLKQCLEICGKHGDKRI